MNKKIQTALNLPLSGKILGISGIQSYYHLIEKTKSKVVEITYPEYDMQKLPFKDEEFDVVISDQVIEHLENPWRAANEATRVLKKGGMVIITTCFLNPLHPSPNDYFRLTEAGLRNLLSHNKLKIMECGGWGNRLALILILIKDSLRFIHIPKKKSIRNWLATWNEEKYSIVTWIVAKKDINDND